MTAALKFAVVFPDGGVSCAVVGVVAPAAMNAESAITKRFVAAGANVGKSNSSDIDY
jgi:hypothetical protein